MNLEKYNEKQLECILTIDKNLHSVACAGSGKTKTIVGRSIYIVEKELATPSEMVAITFTNKAAGEMKERIYTEYEAEFGTTLGLAEMYIGTIHGFCLDQLQNFVPKYKKYEIITDVQRKLLVKKRLTPSYISNIPYYKVNEDLGEPLKPFSLKDIGLVLDTIDFVINEQISIDELGEELVAFYNAYIELLNDRSMLDFSNVQKAYLNQLCENEALIAHVRTLKFITIDEYQDTNTIQEAIILKMKSINPMLNICVVGDDDQTLYEWRGSNLSVFSEFPQRIDNVRTIKLTTNYRSSEGIVRIGENVARSISSGNRIHKEFDCGDTYQYDTGDIIAQTDFSSIEEENEFIIDVILKLKDTSLIKKSGEEIKLNFSHMAILVDSTKNLRKFNGKLLELLEKNKIDYIIDGTNQLFETSEIQIVTDLFLLFATEFCGLKINNNIDFYNESLVRKIHLQPKINTIFTTYANDIDDRYERTLQQFFLDLLDAYDFSKFDYVNREKKLYNFAVFSEIITDFEKIYFLDSLKYRIKEFVRFLFFDAKDIYPEGWLSPKFTESKCLKIMTIYSAKGLEFPIVFMPHLCKNFMFPSLPANGKSKEGILRLTSNNIKRKLVNYKKNDDSYSRLFYVAVTRSMKYLIMTKSEEYSKGLQRSYSTAPNQLKYVQSSSFYISDGNILLNRNIPLSTVDFDKPEQLVFDFSTLKDIFECPRKFQFSSIFGFNTPLNVRMGFGKSLHNMLDDLHSSYLTNHVIKNYDDLSTHLHLPLAPINGTLYTDMHTSANNIMTEYIKINEPMFDTIEYIEAPIDYKLNDLVFINGRVDLIVNSKSDSIKIIDFKSDSSTLSPTLRKKQLLIYAIGYQKLTGRYPTSVVSYDLRSNEPHESNIRFSDIQEVETQINSAYGMIKKNQYPKYKSPTLCSECNFKDICKKIE